MPGAGVLGSAGDGAGLGLKSPDVPGGDVWREPGPDLACSSAAHCLGESADISSDGPRPVYSNGGATLTFELPRGHALESEVLGLLRKVRRELNELWQRSEAVNASAKADEPRTRVTFYFGQHVEDAELAEAGEGK
ncbi:MAG: hypothetical protein ABW217_07585 [Polyangiaceae bacterium]